MKTEKQFVNTFQVEISSKALDIHHALFIAESEPLQNPDERNGQTLKWMANEIMNCMGLTPFNGSYPCNTFLLYVVILYQLHSRTALLWRC